METNFLLDNLVWISGALIIIIFVIPFIVKSRISKRVEAALGGIDMNEEMQVLDGIETGAFVKDFERTGASINDVPQYLLSLEVIGPDQKLYPATVKHYIPYEEVTNLHYNYFMSVLVDPNQPQRVQVTPRSNHEHMQRVYNEYEASYPGTISVSEREQLGRDGKQQAGLLRSIEPLNEMRNDREAYMLEVELLNEPKKIVRRKFFFTPERKEHLLPGKTLTILYLPHNPEVFTFITQ